MSRRKTLSSVCRRCGTAFRSPLRRTLCPACIRHFSEQWPVPLGKAGPDTDAGWELTDGRRTRAATTDNLVDWLETGQINSSWLVRRSGTVGWRLISSFFSIDTLGRVRSRVDSSP